MRRRSQIRPPRLREEHFEKWLEAQPNEVLAELLRRIGIEPKPKGEWLVVVTSVVNKYPRLDPSWELLVKRFDGRVESSIAGYKIYKHVIHVPQDKAQEFMNEWVKRPKYY